MAIEDTSVKLCQESIIQLDLKIKAITQDVYKTNSTQNDLQLLNREARSHVQTMKAELQHLHQLAIEQDKEEDKELILKLNKEYTEQLSQTQMALRQANISSQTSIAKSEKEMLLGGNDSQLKRRQANKQNLVSTTSNVTENLMSLSQKMAAQVQQGHDTMSTLVKSSDQITDTNEEFKNMSGHIQISRKLLTKFGRRELTDKLLIFLALVFFFGTVLYIMKKRIF